MATKTQATRIPAQVNPLDPTARLVRADCGHWAEEGDTAHLMCIDERLCPDCLIEHERHEHCPDCTERVRQAGEE